jgi:hypothetical protein
VLQVVSEPTLAVSWACVARGFGYMAHDICGPRVVTWHHMTTLDIQTWPRGEVPGLGLTDEDVGLLRGVDCDILAPGMVISWPKA